MVATISTLISEPAILYVLYDTVFSFYMKPIVVLKFLPTPFSTSYSTSFSTTYTYSTSASFFAGRAGSLLLNSIRRSSLPVARYCILTLFWIC